MTSSPPPPFAATGEGISIGNISHSHVIAGEEYLIHRTPHRPDYVYQWQDIEALGL